MRTFDSLRLGRSSLHAVALMCTCDALGAESAHSIAIAASQICSGQQVTTVISSDGVINYADFKVSVQAENNLTVTYEGVLLARIDDFSFSKMVDCNERMIAALSHLDNIADRGDPVISSWIPKPLGDFDESYFTITNSVLGDTQHTDPARCIYPPPGAEFVVESLTMGIAEGPGVWVCNPNYVVHEKDKICVRLHARSEGKKGRCDGTLHVQIITP